MIGRNAPLASAESDHSTRSADPATQQPLAGEPGPSRHASPIRDPDRYAILGEHGRGGLGRVSRAHDKDFGRDIAIKELLARGHVNELRFVREAMITARLEHPGIVPVYESGRWPDGTPFYAMKLVQGRSLRTLIAERTTVDDRIGLLHHVIAVADAIAYAHGRNIIHRDLKPANVIVGDFGETVVIDWGLAKDLSDGADLPRGSAARRANDDGLTSAGSILGTPTYMAPEQARGEAVDQRADVFAIGAMLWELCALQKVPPADLGQRHRMLRRSGIDADLVTIVDKALAPDAAQRYPDAGALAADLKAFKSGARIAARDYSLWAMLAHWTRRHRALALSVVVAVALAAVGSGVFVRNIAVERDRADAALRTAQQERDRSKLSEAALVIDQDPNRANQLLASFTTRTPQVALLTSRAVQRSATRIIPISRGGSLFHEPGTETVELLTDEGGLWRLDPSAGTLTELDHGLTEGFTYRDGQPLYGRHREDSPGVEIATPSNRDVIEVGDLGSAEQLVALNHATYVLDTTGDLRRLDGQRSTVVEHAIHGIAGDGDLLLVCRRNGELDIQRGEVTVARRRCAQTKSPVGMVAVGGDYAAITDDGSLISSRGGNVLELPTSLAGEYEIAISTRGVIGLADYVATGGTWFVRSGGTRLEPGPIHASQAYSVTADGDLVAWSYQDGTVFVRDTVEGATWELRGHVGFVGYVAIDAANARVISLSRRELRIWDLKSPPTSVVASMPCSIFHIEPSSDLGQVGLDCNNGSVWVWARRTGAITQIQKHGGYSFGLRWIGGRLCSGGRGDGLVLCSNADGTELETIDPGGKFAESLVGTPGTSLIVAANGKVWRFDRTLHKLYDHQGKHVFAALSENGRLLASCAEDGSLAVFDLLEERLVWTAFAHADEPCSVSWTGEELWSSGKEGTLKRWLLRDGDLQLRHMVQVSGTLRSVKVLRRGWAAIEGANTLLVSRDGATVAVRIDAGRAITALDVSADQRYVAASMNGEILVVDLQQDAVATVATGAPIQQLRFLEPALIAFSEPAALKTLRIDQLTYVPYVATPEPPNRASF